MTTSSRRGILYGAAVLVAAGLLFAGFGISFPPDPATRLNGAVMLAEAGDTDGALAVCATVLDEHPGNLDARVYRATFLGRAKRYDDAVAAFDDALRHTDDAEVRRDLAFDRASVLLEAGRTEDYRRARTELAAQGGHRLHLLDGMAAAREGALDRAVAAFRRAHEEAPEDDHARARLWNALVDQGQKQLASRDFNDALASFDGAAGLFPSAYKAHLRAAEVRLAMGEPLDALERLRAIGPRAPGVAPLVFRGATALLEKGNDHEAFAALEGALAVDFESVRTLLEAEPAWKNRRQQADVRALLDSKQQKTGAGLTGQG